MLVGGDHFGEHRFYQPLWLLLPIAALFGLACVYEPLGLKHPVAALRPFRYLLLPPLFLLFSWSNEQKWHELEHGELIGQFGVAESGRATGEHLNVFFQSVPAPEVGFIAAGGIKLTYAGPINDLLGLNNVAMAHSGGDRRGHLGHAGFDQEVLYAQRPEVLLPYPPARDLSTVNAEPHPFANDVLDNILTTSRFRETYRFTILEGTTEGSTVALAAYFRHDYLDTLLDSGLFSIHPGFASTAEHEQTDEPSSAGSLLPRDARRLPTRAPTPASPPS